MGWVKAGVRFKGNFCHNFSGANKGQVQTFTDRKQLIDRLIESKDYEKSIFLPQNVSKNARVILNVPTTPASCGLFSLFSTATILQKNCTLQRDSNLDHWSSRQAHWPPPSRLILKVIAIFSMMTSKKAKFSTLPNRSQIYLCAEDTSKPIQFISVSEAII